MNIDHSILTIITFIPLAGAILLAFLPDRGKVMQWAALAVTLVTFIATLHLPVHYNYSAASGSFQFEQNISWIASPAIRYHLGVDGLSMWLVVLTGFLAPLGVLISWRAIDTRKKLFYIQFLLLQVAMFGVFVSLDLFLYYGFWELSLVPMVVLIAVFGRTENRRKAALKYFLYTFIPSAILLVGMLWVYAQTGTFDVPTLIQLAATHGISTNSAALWLASLAFLGAFAVKVPVFPLHGWLSDAVFEAPTAAVMVLAGKLGLYSILRFSFGIFPEQSRHIAPLLIALGAIGVVYGALIALVQDDMKRLAAFATLGHVSLVVLGIFSFTIAGIDGGIYATLNEGIGGAALFILLGALYERYSTYNMRELGGLAQKLPWMVTFYVITALSVVGLPMLNGFVGEFLVLSGSMQSEILHHTGWTVLATTGVILTASYMLWMIQRIFYGDLGHKSTMKPAADLNLREHLTLWPLAILMLAMGVVSPFWMRAIDGAGVVLAQQPVQTAPATTSPSVAATSASPQTVIASTLDRTEAR
ncbi:NADH:ubiquinone oxidoreductase subunit M [Edaphobacter acidisoli]|uniref:NADH:ubiquinone oxidoreductase subunit M n=1 Tax=Edaphobacter acidisoli TaxID=2040573 RepID=A0A916RPB6_9BACT|nr:NADH-quinone oxidoreductase subunit M [Edaphobacter acidisoli]GGA62731.1 NADH:ubiquinone oxidoreductase subunit M [Edaphobacter acidisoli]